jgi:hypothetical protein
MRPSVCDLGEHWVFSDGLSQRGCDENHVYCDSFAADDPVSPAGLIDRDGRSRGEIPTPPKVRRGFLDCNSKDSDLSKEEFDVATDKTFLETA